MGILGSLMSGMGKMVGEQLWPIYTDARRNDAYTLEKIIANETNNTRKAVYLLALGEKDRFKARELYSETQRSYNTAFSNLRNYQKFSQAIDMFMRNCT